MRFIRKHGRVIPIDGPSPAAHASMVGVKSGAIMAGGGYGLHAIHSHAAKKAAAGAKIAAAQFKAGDASKFQLTVGLAKSAVVHHKEALMGRKFGRVGLGLYAAGTAGLLGLGYANRPRKKA